MKDNICPKCGGDRFLTFCTWKTDMKLCCNCGYKEGELDTWIIDYIDMSMEELTKKLEEEIRYE